MARSLNDNIPYVGENRNPCIDISDDGSIARHCNRMRVGEDGTPKPAAFQLREGKDDCLSVNYVECFDTPNFDDKMRAVQIEVNKQRQIRNGVFAILDVGHVKRTVKEKLGISLTIEAYLDYKSHTGICGYAADNLQVAQKLSEMVKKTYPINTDLIK